MTTSTDFRWGRAMLHAGLALALTVAVTGTLAVVLDVADPRRFGEGVGRLASFVVLGALGASWLFQTGRRAAGWVVTGLLAALLAVLVVLAVTVAGGPPRRAPPLAAVALVRDSDRIRHPGLGFSIPDPGPTLSERPELAAAQLPPTEDARAWVFGDEAAGEVVIVMLAAEAASDARTFDAFFAGVLRGQTSAMGDAGLVADERERSVDWANRRAHAYVVVGDTIHVRVDLFGLRGGEAVALVSAATEAGRFADLAGGMRLR